jgi:hypothetical protein
MRDETPKWHDNNAKDNPPFLDALAKVRDIAIREGWCYFHVQAIIVAIDQYAEAATDKGRRTTSSSGYSRSRPIRPRWKAGANCSLTMTNSP